MATFSVIIPTYNRYDFVLRTLASVRGQSFSDYEVIIVDDGSTDDSFEKLQSETDRVTVLRQSRNRGPGVARNRGASVANGAYLAFLDSDDLWFPWTLEIYQEVISTHLSPSFVVGRPYVFSHIQELDGAVFGLTTVEMFADYLASGDQWRWWGASSFVIRRDVFGSMGGFAEDLVNGEDADLALRLGVASGFVQIKSPVTFAYREHQASAKKDLKRTVAGAWLQVKKERRGCYPGGPLRAAERRAILTRHIRPVTFSCLQQGLWRDAWALYMATFIWNAWLRRLRYLAAFPVVAGWAYGREFGNTLR
jgi:glycosyltransferase involved in cell wall biosynthesis